MDPFPDAVWKQTQFHYSGPGAIYFFDHISPHTDTTKLENHTISWIFPSCVSSDFLQWLLFTFLNSCSDSFSCHHQHPGPLAFCLSIQSIHITPNNLRYSKSVHINGSELPFICQTSASSHLAGKKQKTKHPRCNFLILALALTCAHLHRGIVSILSHQPHGPASIRMVWNLSNLKARFPLTGKGNARKARQFDTIYHMSCLIGACFICVHSSVGFRVNY